MPKKFQRKERRWYHVTIHFIFRIGPSIEDSKEREFHTRLPPFQADSLKAAEDMVSVIAAAIRGTYPEDCYGWHASLAGEKKRLWGFK